jgi:hypothetical protein
MEIADNGQERFFGRFSLYFSGRYRWARETSVASRGAPEFFTSSVTSSEGSLLIVLLVADR